RVRRAGRAGNGARPRWGVEGGVGGVRLAAVATRLSRTVRLGKIWRPSGTRPSPAWAMRNDGNPWIDRPSNAMVPARAGNNPMIERTVVVLPTPLRPSRVT